MIATSGISAHVPKGQSLAEFSPKVSMNQIYAAWGSEYDESGNSSSNKPWVANPADCFLDNKTVAKLEGGDAYDSRNNWIYTWWDNTDKSWRTEGHNLAQYADNMEHYFFQFEGLWPTN